MRRAMLLIGVMTGLLVLGALVLDEGEVVTLLTEADGREYPTHLWIVELDDRKFVRANRPSAHWLSRIRANPEVSLVLSGGHHAESEPYRARLVLDAQLKARVDAAMAEKYRLADRTWGRLVDRQGAQVIELERRFQGSATTGRNPSSKENGVGS